MLGTMWSMEWGGVGDGVSEHTPFWKIQIY